MGVIVYLEKHKVSKTEGCVATFPPTASKNYPHVTSKIIFCNSFYVFWVVKFANPHPHQATKEACFCQISTTQESEEQTD